MEVDYQLHQKETKQQEDPMKFKSFLIKALVLSLTGMGLILPATGWAAGLLKPVNGNQNRIRIDSHHVEVTLNNGFARTEVDQVFANSGDTDLEATYTFPLPKQASLSEVSLWIDGNEVVGEVLEKQAARQAYEDQQAKGNDTALATKDDHKTFDIRVSPVRAGQQTRVRLVYYQPLEIDLNIGRYVYPLAEGNLDEERISFWSVDDKVDGTFSFNLKLKSAFPVKDVRMPGYQNDMVVSQQTIEGEGEIYDVSLAFAEGADLSRDVVFYYRLDDATPARVELIPYREDPRKEGAFMVVVTPGATLQPIAHGTDWTFVLDRSGSMGGNKIQTLIDGVSRVIGKMTPLDRFRIVTFNNAADDFTNGFITATAENVRRVLARIGAMEAGGGTNLYDGLEMAYRGIDDDRTTALVIATDGVANVGPSTYADLMRLHRRHDVRLFTFVIGNSANRPLLEALAGESGGFAMNISGSDDLVGRIIQAKTRMLHQAIADTRLTFDGERVKDVTPKALGNLFAGQQVVAFGHYNGHGPVKVTLSGKIDGREHEWYATADLPEVDRDNPEIERLWALSAIEDTMTTIRDKGESDTLKQQVIDTAMAYSLVTDYTAMVVMAEEEMEQMGVPRRNADRVAKERQAHARRAVRSVKSYQVNRPAGSADSGASNISGPSGGIGSGPVGPLFVGLALVLRWFRRRSL
jgi:Ca-activated chloride channel family protein